MSNGRRDGCVPKWKPLILIIEDDEDMAKFNSRILTRQNYEVAIANTVADALGFISKNTPDLFVLDISLPDGNGLDLCRELRKGSDAPVLFLTGKTGTEDKISGLNAGGDYYLTKPYNVNEFVAAIQNLLRRAERMREKIAGVSAITKGSLTLKIDERKAYVNGLDVGLSSKEFSTLLLLVQNEGKELTCEQMYAAVWDAPMNDDSSALRKQISRVKKKLDEKNSSDFSIYNEHGKGYTFCCRT